MLYLKSQKSLWLAIGFVVLIIVVATGSQLMQAQQTFDAPTFKQEVQQLQSFGREQAFLIDQLSQNKIPQTYFVGQTKHIDEKVLSFYPQLHGSKVTPSQRQNIDQLGKLVFDFSRTLQMVAENPKDKAQVASAKQHIADLLGQLDALSKEAK